VYSYLDPSYITRAEYNHYTINGILLSDYNSTLEASVTVTVYRYILVLVAKAKQLLTAFFKGRCREVQFGERSGPVLNLCQCITAELHGPSKREPE
jgi:hypothetical protein